VLQQAGPDRVGGRVQLPQRLLGMPQGVGFVTGALGVERIVLMGRHKERTDLGREFGATDVIAERGEEGLEKVRHPHRAGVRRPQVGLETAFGVGRHGGVVSRVGAPQYADRPMDFGTFMRNITLTGGVAPARAHIERLLPDMLDGTIQPAGFSTAPSASKVPAAVTVALTGVAGPWPHAARNPATAAVATAVPSHPRRHVPARHLHVRSSVPPFDAAARRRVPATEFADGARQRHDRAFRRAGEISFRHFLGGIHRVLLSGPCVTGSRSAGSLRLGLVLGLQQPHEEEVFPAVWI